MRRAVDEDLSDKQRPVSTAITVAGVPADVLAAGLRSSRNAVCKALFEAARSAPSWPLTATVPSINPGASAPDPAGRATCSSRTLATPGEITFSLVDRYVNAELHGPGSARRFPAMAAHLRSCQPCQ